jgi:hypothetical protein
MMRSKIVWTTLITAGLFAGCKKDDNKAAATDKATDKGTAAPATDKGSAAAPAADPAKSGMNDPSNDPAVIAKIKTALADCGSTMDQSTGNSDKPNQKKSLYSCDKWSADFGDVEAPFDKAAKTFINLLDDPDVKVRAVGVYGLSKDSSWEDDKDLATRVINGLKKEKAPSPIDASWALAVREIPTSTGVDDQIKALALDPNTSGDVKLNIAAWWSSPAGYDVVKNFASSTDPNLINAAVQGYALHFDDHTDEACAYWVAHLETASKDANEYAIGHLTGGWDGNTTGDSDSEDYITGGGGGPSSSDDKRCTADQLQKGLDLIAKEFAAGGDYSDMTYALAFLAKDAKSPDAIKKAAVTQLKAMVEKKGYGLRSDALRALGDAGDPSLKDYINGFAKDDDLKETVDEINKPKQ